MFSALFIAFSTGFLSLSLEILWIRLFSFANHSLPQAFAFVLIMYLIGIALGARIGKLICSRQSSLFEISGIILLFSSIIDLISPWIYSEFAHTNLQLLMGALFMILTALLKSILFPIVHHIGTPTNTTQIGKAISRVYVANILGSTIGPLFTGIVMLSYFTTQQCFIICAALTFLVAIYCLMNIWKPIVLSTATLVAIVSCGYFTTLYHNLLIARVANNYGPVRQIIENQHGIITLYLGGNNGDIVAGGNVYDGRTNLDPLINSNGLNRVLVLSALQAHPKRILLIGLSIGTWLNILTNFNEAESIDVVEINPGYLKAIENYLPQQSALLDPRVHLYIDDGRRWLKTHDTKYDLIVMNTTYYWRAYSSNLLSTKFLALLKKHMNPDAVLAYNSTYSPDVLKTASSEFKYVYLYQNFVIAANFDWRVNLRSQQAASYLKKLSLNGKLFFPKGSDSLIAQFLNEPLGSLPTIESRYGEYGRKLEIITDENLVTEYRYGKNLANQY